MNFPLLHRRNWLRCWTAEGFFNLIRPCVWTSRKRNVSFSIRVGRLIKHFRHSLGSFFFHFNIYRFKTDFHTKTSIKKHGLIFRPRFRLLYCWKQNKSAMMNVTRSSKIFFFLDLANTRRSTSLFVRQDFLVIRGDPKDCLLGIRVYELRNIHTLRILNIAVHIFRMYGVMKGIQENKREIFFKSSLLLHISSTQVITQ